MQVVLTKRVPKLGEAHDIVNVKTGFAQNFLFPQKLAIPATEKAVVSAKAVIAERVKKAQEVSKNAREIAEKLKETTLNFKMKASDEGKLYGSVKESDIVDALANQHKIELPASAVKLSEQIKSVGEHKATVKLAENVSVTLSLAVEAE
jgi:large subunit ribosomal protein L9